MNARRAVWIVALTTVVTFAVVATSSLAQESTTKSALIMADEVASDVEAIRGWKFKHPVKKDVYTEDQLKEYVIKKLEEEYPDDVTEMTEAFLHTVGALPDDVPLKQTIIDVLLSQVGGFYDPATSAFFMIDRKGVSYGPAVNRIMIAHELTHALDDQYVDLDSLQKARDRTEDGEFVVGSLIEGSATALMTTYVTKAQIAGELAMDDLMALMESEKERSKVFFEAPRYFQTLVAYYTCGMTFLLKGDLAAVMGGGELVGDNLLATIADPPRSSEQILHPGKYWDAESRDDPVVVDDAAMKKLMASLDYEVLATNTAGEIMMGVLTTPEDKEFDAMAAGMSSYWTNDAASGWGGDRFYLLEKGDKRSSVWVTLWDTEEDRDQFVTAIEAEVYDASRERFLLGKRGAVFTYDMGKDAAKKMTEAVSGSPPGFSQGNDPWTP